MRPDSYAEGVCPISDSQSGELNVDLIRLHCEGW